MKEKVILLISYTKLMNNITQTQAISSLTDFILHVCSSSFTVSVHHSIISNLHIFLSLSSSFLLVAGWWLSYSYRCFLPLCESHMSTHSQNITFLWHWKTQVFWTESHGTQGQNSLKPIKPGLCLENWDEWSPNVWHIFSFMRTPRRYQFTQFSLALQYVSQRWWTKLAWYRWGMHVSTMYSLTVQKGTWYSKTYPIFVNCGMNLHDTSCCNHIVHRYLTKCVQ
jgi:hypothetical protein